MTSGGANGQRRSASDPGCAFDPLLAPTVDAVVPTRNTRALTLRCVEALRRAGPAVNVQCVVVDNASTDGTADELETRFPDITLRREVENRGFGTACNVGARFGGAELILILNSDAIARPGALERLAGFLNLNADYVLAAGQLVDPGTNHPQVGFSVRGFPTLVNQLAVLTGLERYWPRNPISVQHLMLGFDYERTQELTAQPAGACLLIRRADFEAIGGFDEGFFYWFEDVDIIRRLQGRGKIGYVHDAVFDHVGGASFAQWSRPEVIVARYAGLLRYFGKHRPAGEVIVLRAVVAGLAALRALGFILIDPPRARAYVAVLTRAVRSG
jgi:N-acetylglucosaminyl-diphospho-decaprenol L-rhamnosyltransferase